MFVEVAIFYILFPSSKKDLYYLHFSRHFNLEITSFFNNQKSSGALAACDIYQINQSNQTNQSFLPVKLFNRILSSCHRCGG
jgi:hypothetical protein